MAKRGAANAGRLRRQDPYREGPLGRWAWSSSHRPSCPPRPHLHPSPYPPFIPHRRLSQAAACTPDPTCSLQAWTSTAQSCPEISTHHVGGQGEPTSWHISPSTSSGLLSRPTRSEMSADQKRKLGAFGAGYQCLLQEEQPWESHTDQGADSERELPCEARTLEGRDGGRTGARAPSTQELDKPSEEVSQEWRHRSRTQESPALSKQSHDSCHRPWANKRGHTGRRAPTKTEGCPGGLQEGRGSPACLSQPGASGHCGNCWLLQNATFLPALARPAVPVAMAQPWAGGSPAAFINEALRDTHWSQASWWGVGGHCRACGWEPQARCPETWPHAHRQG